jgi:hypothetical protein
MENEWTNWYSGDAIGSDSEGSARPLSELIGKIAMGFRHVVFNWSEGDRWAEARIAAWKNMKGPPLIMQLEEGLRGHTVHVSIADQADTDSPTVCFFLTPDTCVFELHYEPPGREAECRAMAIRLAEKIGYGFSPLEDLK